MNNGECRGLTKAANGIVGRRAWVLASLLALTLAACGGGDDAPGSGAAGSAGGGAGGAPATTGVGTLQVNAHWSGSIPEGTKLKVAVFACPFTMPPKRVLVGDVDGATGEATATDAKVPTGDWCLMAYYDLDPNDGLAPVKGLDPVNATGRENEKSSLPVSVQDGKTTAISLELKVAADN